MTPALLLACALTAAWAGNFGVSARGTTAAEFLNLGVGARAAAMGDAITGAVDDATAVYWNPAAITNVESRSVALMHAALEASTSFDYAGYVQNGGRYGVFAFAAQYYAAGNLTQSDAAGNVVGNFNPYDLALHFTYARRIADGGALGGWSWGATVKLIDSRILNSASAGAIDLGLLSRPMLDGRIRWGASASNLGGDQLQYEATPEDLPVRVQLGGAFRLTPALLSTADATFVRGDRPFAGVGLEYWLVPDGPWRLAARGGYNTRTFSGVNGFAGESMGFGLASGGWDVDYALTLMGGLGPGHRLSVRCQF